CTAENRCYWFGNWWQPTKGNGSKSILYQSKSVLPIQRQPIEIMPKATAPVVPVLLIVLKKYDIIVKPRKIYKLQNHSKISKFELKNGFFNTCFLPIGINYF
ncbi:hypothetical protein, partial [Flavobacterium psychrophilum]|uniref:hypothetical protein n=1 Tax=Flavobacterium psychrophilum TaxID=96345 RepID=UPI001ABC1C89